MKKERETVIVDIGFEHFMEFIYGFHGHGCITGRTSVQSWKKHVLQLFRTLKTAITKNVTGDDRHQEYMIGRCDIAISAIRGAESKDAITTSALRFAFAILFELLGRFPQNAQSRRAHHSRVTDLSKYRTFSYTRTARQKAQLITDSAYEKRLTATDPSFEVLIEKLKRDFSDDPHKFLAWLRSEHRTLYDRFI